MTVRVLFFGVLKDIFHRDSESMDLPAGSTVADLLQTCRDLPGLSTRTAIWASIAVAVNQEYAGLGVRLAEGDEVALLPPVSGGAGDAVMLVPLPATLTHDVIDREEAISSVRADMRAGEDGALVIFDGVVRNNTRGRRTLYLDYTAYETMALLEMNRLVEEARQKFAVRAIALTHRLGRIAIGETSVLIVVASAHRGAAFDACRWVIDTLKKTVPIWKKEYFEDGAVWSDGESFPEEVLRGMGTTSVAISAATEKEIL